ncbi:MAG: M16 family metallopeptidase [Fidelibacterota bacterium]
MRKHHFFLFLLIFIISFSFSSAQIQINFEKYELPNGLDVILHEDHSTPIVAVNVWYHVGSKNEVPGKTGFAHLFEHMMFQGSENVGDDEHFKYIQDAGGSANGSTNPDRTNYWEVVPGNYLEMVLWLEADRMGYLLPAVNLEKLNNQRDVVKNERRQNYENRPYGLARKMIYENLYPEDHPYHWLTIGTQEDLTNASLEDVTDFFKRYYGPNNASLSIGGDFDPAQVKELVEKYFGSIPPGPPVKTPEVPIPSLTEEKRLVMEDKVQLPRIYMAWHTVPLFAPDDAELDVLSDILSSGKNSRLYKRLVYELQIAQDVWTYQSSGEIAGVFFIISTAKPGNNLSELEKVIFEELEKIKSEGPLEREVQRSVNQMEASFIYRLQSLGGFGGKTDQLNAYNIWTGNPGYFNEDLDRYRNVTPEDVKRVANKYLIPDKRVVLSVVPEGKLELQASP